jgi:hypothetical protein
MGPKLGASEPVSMVPLSGGSPASSWSSVPVTTPWPTTAAAAGSMCPSSRLAAMTLPAIALVMNVLVLKGGSFPA